MADIPKAPLEGDTAESVDNMPMPFMTQDAGGSALQAVLLRAVHEATVAVQRLGSLRIARRDVREVTPLASAERTARTFSSTFTNPGARGIILTLDVTAITDTPSIVLCIDDPTHRSASTTRGENLFTASAPVTATGTHTYVLYPNDIAIADDVVEVQKLGLPRSWEVVVTHDDTDPITYSVSGAYLI